MSTALRWWCWGILFVWCSEANKDRAPLYLFTCDLENRLNVYFIDVVGNQFIPDPDPVITGRIAISSDVDFMY